MRKTSNNRSGGVIFISSSQLFSSDSGVVDFVHPGMEFFQLCMVGGEGQAREGVQDI